MGLAKRKHEMSASELIECLRHLHLTPADLKELIGLTLEFINEDLEGRAQGMKSSRDGAGLHIGQIYAMLTRNDDCKCRAALRLIGEI